MRLISDSDLQEPRNLSSKVKSLKIDRRISRDNASSSNKHAFGHLVALRRH